MLTRGTSDATAVSTPRGPTTATRAARTTRSRRAVPRLEHHLHGRLRDVRGVRVHERLVHRGVERLADLAVADSRRTGRGSPRASPRSTTNGPVRSPCWRASSMSSSTGMSASTIVVHARARGRRGRRPSTASRTRSTAARGCSRPPATAAAPRAARPPASRRPTRPSRTTSSSAPAAMDSASARICSSGVSSSSALVGSRRHLRASSSSSTISASTTSSSDGVSAAGCSSAGASPRHVVRRVDRLADLLAHREQGRVLGLDLVDVGALERRLQLGRRPSGPRS